MSLFTLKRSAVALNTAADTLTIVASATKPLRILIADVKGMGTASAANEVVLSRSSGGTTPGGAITPTPLDPAAAAASFSAYTTYAVAPTIGAPLWGFGVNANGGQDKFIALPGAEIPVPVGTQVSLRSAAGTSLVGLNFLVEELG